MEIMLPLSFTSLCGTGKQEFNMWLVIIKCISIGMAANCSFPQDIMNQFIPQEPKEIEFGLGNIGPVGCVRIVERNHS